MADDDATIIILRFYSTGVGDNLGITTSHELGIVAERQKAFLEAVNERDKERMAIAYGDGRDFKRAKIKISQAVIDDARMVADALNEVRQTYFATFNCPNASLQIKNAWQKHEPLFQKTENRV